MYRRCVAVVAFTVAVSCLGGTAAAQTQALSTPHLEGDWKGTATKTICGEPGGTSDVEMFLLDDAYKATGSKMASGNVSGTLIVDGTPGKIVGLYQAPQLKADVPAMAVPVTMKSPFADYYFDFTAKDPLLGVGYYQTLSGTLSRKNIRCINLGSQGEVLKVDLEKQ